ncbi:MAG: hypothetical protein EHM17_01285 [Verrucomicrobiaceae bacterium]|nr:MAG: hypothetical protein EHM17_01285 [Verrucomicrobiaceae bacterium]
MTCGLSFLETTANPYVLSMGDSSTATRRLNLAQAFNPMGSIIVMFVASMVILINLNGTIFIHGYGGLYCLIGVSACMSLRERHAQA